MQLVFDRDHLNAIAIEGLSTNETAKPGASAEEVADLTLYFGTGDTFVASENVQTAQFKYKTTAGVVTASYLKKTIEKFADTIKGYEQTIPAADIDKKLTFAFVTNAEFSPELSAAIEGLRTGVAPTKRAALAQYNYLDALCSAKNVNSKRLFSRCEFRASEESLPVINSKLRRTVVDWSAGDDIQAKARLFDLVELVRKKAGTLGKANNLIKREDVLTGPHQIMKCICINYKNSGLSGAAPLILKLTGGSELDPSIYVGANVRWARAEADRLDPVLNGSAIEFIMEAKTY